MTTSRRATESRRAIARAVRHGDTPADYWRPTTRADCAAGPRPCPYVACRHHLYLDVHPVRGTIRRNAPDLESMTETCALDVASHGGSTSAEVGQYLGLCRERVQQIERAAFLAARTGLALAE